MSGLLRRQKEQSYLGVVRSAAVAAWDVASVVDRHRHARRRQLVLEGHAEAAALRDENRFAVLQVADVEEMFLRT